MHCNCPTHNPGPPSDDAARPATSGGVIRLTYLTDGRVLCALCFEYKWPCELHIDDQGYTNDICTPCAIAESDTTSCSS